MNEGLVFYPGDAQNFKVFQKNKEIILFQSLYMNSDSKTVCQNPLILQCASVHFVAHIVC